MAGSSLKWTTSFFLKKIIYLHRVLVAACGIQFPDQGTLLASGSPGNSLSAFLTRAVIDHYPSTPPPLDDYILFLCSKLLFLLCLLSPTPMPTKPTNSVCPVTERTAPRMVASSLQKVLGVAVCSLSLTWHTEFLGPALSSFS